MNELHEVTEKVTAAYKRITNVFDEMDTSDDDNTLLAQIQTILHKNEKTKQAKIQSELSRIEKVMHGWARVTKTCEKEYEIRKGRVNETKDKIRRMNLELESLIEVVRQLQDEMLIAIEEPEGSRGGRSLRSPGDCVRSTLIDGRISRFFPVQIALLHACMHSFQWMDY